MEPALGAVWMGKAWEEIGLRLDEGQGNMETDLLTNGNNIQTENKIQNSVKNMP